MKWYIVAKTVNHSWRVRIIQEEDENKADKKFREYRLVLASDGYDTKEIAYNELDKMKKYITVIMD